MSRTIMTLLLKTLFGTSERLENLTTGLSFLLYSLSLFDLRSRFLVGLGLWKGCYEKFKRMRHFIDECDGL